MKPLSRRNFTKSILAVPFLASGVPSILATNDSVHKEFGYKFKTSLNVYSFNKPLSDGDIDLFDVLDFCAEHNFDAIDPTGYYFPGYPEVPSDKFMMKFKRKAFLLGLDISGTGIRNDFANPDEKSRKADIELIKKWVVASAKMGIQVLRIFSGKDSDEGYTRDQVFEWMTKDIKECCDFARDYGVIIALQNHNEFLKTADDVNRIFKMVDSEWLGLNLDIGSYRQSDPYKEIAKNIKHAVTWQVKENVWIEGEETPTDLVKLFKIIKKADYRGYLPIETLGAGDPFKKVPQMMTKIYAALKQVNS